MAIIIEQEKRKINLFVVATTAIVIGIVGAGVYYLFFINPGAIEMTIPGASNLKLLKETTQIKFNPNEVFENAAFKKLQLYIEPLKAEQPGYNSSPFAR